MTRVSKYLWFRFIMVATGWLPDFTPILRFRGWLCKPAFMKCGRNFQIASGTIILYSSRICIGDDVFVANNCWIQGAGTIVFKDQVMLGPFTVLASNNHTKANGSYRFGDGETEPIILNKGAWAGAHSVITAGVTVGTGSAVAAGAVVTKDVPDNCIVAGVPARLLAKN
ncbi:MAG: hypothetical protein A2Y07_11085 [Planctomycetes bacterium GWF2_50_10]|nr:MAG: hypothetical protein A2Y07_11085 [Planctomycetes bacterium GWF2_50_10]